MTTDTIVYLGLVQDRWVVRPADRAVTRILPLEAARPADEAIAVARVFYPDALVAVTTFLSSVRTRLPRAGLRGAMGGDAA
jgi:hypothetical protein